MRSTVRTNGRVRRFAKSRSSSGQALLGGIGAIALIVAITVGAVFLLGSVGLVMYYQLKLSHVADDAARQGVLGKYWLGAKRPDFKPEQVDADVRRLVQAQLQEMGMPTASEIIIDQSRSDVCTVTIRVDGLKLLSGGNLPGFINLEQTASRSYGEDNPPGLLGIGFDTGNGIGKGFFFPIYGRGVTMVHGRVTSLNLDGGVRSFPIERSAHRWQTEYIPNKRIVRHR